MPFTQVIDMTRLKEDFIKENMKLIPPEFQPYADAWKVSAAHFVDLFLEYLDRQGLEISFKQRL
ncbi:MAG: hypothetical protein JRI57_02530 [Deltaproteobacteria bacterium]|nr:hypothetical protein [Deltaproteobacteria bacterium]MBW1953071.1 hypothetical protein [Deltaproteobacteria bacterium]MBW1986711.1 hypothetical protein [Deltaproteobacteria bacterium]MBW2134557.1 hypothetical protein [Deltaproteobacteria bacterium]